MNANTCTIKLAGKTVSFHKRHLPNQVEGLKSARFVRTSEGQAFEVVQAERAPRAVKGRAPSNIMLDGREFSVYASTSPTMLAAIVDARGVAYRLVRNSNFDAR